MEEESSRLQHAVPCDKTVRVTGNVENFEFGLLGEQAIGEGATVHAGHNDVGDEQIDPLTIQFRNAEGFFRFP